MGQKCSCLCNKDLDNQFNFYPEGSNVNDNLNHNEVKVKSKQHNPSQDTISKHILINNFRMNDSNNKNYMLNQDSQTQQKFVLSTSKTNIDNNDIFSKEEFNYLQQNIGSLLKIQRNVRTFLMKSFYKKSKVMLKNESYQIKKQTIQQYMNPKVSESIELMKNNPLNYNKWKDEEYLKNLEWIEIEKVNLQMNKNKSRLQNIYYTDMYLNPIDNSLYCGYMTTNLKKHGLGSLWHKNGEIYEGNWINNEFTGYGRFTNVDGNVFEGKFLINMLLYLFY